MGNCKGNHRACWQRSSRVDETFAGIGSGGPAWLMECGLMTSSDTSETTVLSEQMGKVTVTLALFRITWDRSGVNVPRSSCSAPPTTLTWEAPPTLPRTQLHLLCEEVPRFLLKENSRLRDLKIWEQQTMGCSSLPACSSLPVCPQGQAWFPPPPGSPPRCLQPTLVSSFPNASPVFCGTWWGRGRSKGFSGRKLGF